MFDRRFMLCCAALAVWVCAACGCGVRGSLTLKSVANGGTLTPKVRVLAYRTDEPQSADIYLTDLSLADLDPGVDPKTLTGNFIHIHQFLMPKAGSTPIASAASNVTIRYVVMSRGAIGVYGGGGFLLPSGAPGDSSFGGSMKGATMKLIQANPLFHDPMGACDLSASFRVPLDESLARLMGARLDDILALSREK